MIATFCFLYKDGGGVPSAITEAFDVNSPCLSATLTTAKTHNPRVYICGKFDKWPKAKLMCQILESQTPEYKALGAKALQI